MTTPLRRDWAWKMYRYMGFRPTEDDEDLRQFNRCIKSIIQSEMMKDRKRHVVECDCKNCREARG